MLNDKQFQVSAGRSGTQMGNRAPYNKPELTVFGSVKKLTSGTFSSTNDSGGSQGGKTASDRRLKENITRIGRHPLGFGLYLFDYKSEFQGDHGYGRQFGVMADEVEPVVPAAVGIATDGYRRVDYNVLGISNSL